MQLRKIPEGPVPPQTQSGASGERPEVTLSCLKPRPEDEANVGEITVPYRFGTLMMQEVMVNGASVIAMIDSGAPTQYRK